MITFKAMHAAAEHGEAVVERVPQVEYEVYERECA